MIQSGDFVNQKWSFIARNSLKSFSSAVESFSGKLKQTQAKLPTASTALQKYHLSELVSTISIWNEHIEISKSEAEIIVNFANYLMVMDLEKTKMKLHIKYIVKENVWLKSEMHDLNKLLIHLEDKFLDAEAEKKYLQCYYNMRNYARENIKKYAAASKIPEEEEGDSEPEDDVPKDLTALFHLVSQYISENRHIVASCWCTQNVTNFKKKYGEVSKEVGAIYNLLGRIYKNSEALNLAQEYFERSLTIREKVHGKDSDQVGITLSLLGSTLGKMGKFKKGLEICQRALLIRENIYGRNNEVAHLYAKIAEYSIELKLWNEAVTNYKVCLGIFDVSYDSTDKIIIKSYTKLSLAFLNTENPNKALECLAKVNLSYIIKNNPGSSKTSTPLTVIEEYLKRNIKEFPAEMLLQRFGSISETLDEAVVDVMGLYYEKMEKPEVVEMLKGWIYLSNRNINRPTSVIISQAQENRKTSYSSKMETERRESKSTSVRQSIRSIFKGKS